MLGARLGSFGAVLGGCCTVGWACSWWWNGRFGDGRKVCEHSRNLLKNQRWHLLLIADSRRKQNAKISRNGGFNLDAEQWQCHTIHPFPIFRAWIEYSCPRSETVYSLTPSTQTCAVAIVLEQNGFDVLKRHSERNQTYQTNILCTRFFSFWSFSTALGVLGSKAVKSWGIAPSKTTASRTMVREVEACRRKNYFLGYAFQNVYFLGYTFTYISIQLFMYVCFYWYWSIYLSQTDTFSYLCWCVFTQGNILYKRLHWPMTAKQNLFRFPTAIFCCHVLQLCEGQDVTCESHVFVCWYSWPGRKKS